MIDMLNKPFFPKISFASFRKGLVVFIIAFGLFSTGYLLGCKNVSIKDDTPKQVIITRDKPQGKEDLDFDLFWKVWDTLDTKYFDKSKLIPSEMVYGAVKGMVAAVGDPYTIFLPPVENKVVQEDLQGSFEGVGIQIGFKGSRLAVVSPLPGSPAEEAGAKAGDFIIGIKDVNKSIDRGTVGITLPEAVQIIRGPAGSTVTLVLIRGESEEPIVIDIIRSSIEVPSIQVSYVGENETIANIRLMKFSGDTIEEWEEVIIKLLKKRDLGGIIIDVRNNPGGYLQGAVDLSSEFLDTGILVVKEEGSSGFDKEFRVERIGRLKNQKVVVLINGGSASASEILAGALRDQKDVMLVGQTSFGKGTIQESQQVDSGAGLHITIARWITPSGFWVNEGGLVPDFEVEDNPETTEDEQLQKAIELF